MWQSHQARTLSPSDCRARCSSAHRCDVAAQELSACRCCSESSTSSALVRLYQLEPRPSGIEQICRPHDSATVELLPSRKSSASGFGDAQGIRSVSTSSKAWTRLQRPLREGIRAEFAPGGELSCRSNATNWNATAFSPVIRLHYLIANKECAIDTAPGSWRKSNFETAPPMKYLRALDIESGKAVRETLKSGPLRVMTTMGRGGNSRRPSVPRIRRRHFFGARRARW